MGTRKSSFRLLSVLICAVAVLAVTVACSSEKEETKTMTSESTTPRTLRANQFTMPNCAYNVTNERIHEVRLRNNGLFWRQPNVHAVAEGDFRNKDRSFTNDAFGIIVEVSTLVDQSTLPEANRIPLCIEGIPIQILEIEPFEWEYIPGLPDEQWRAILEEE